MKIMTVEEAQAKLAEIIKELQPGEEVILKSNDGRVAKLVGQPLPTGRPIFGRGRGMLTVIAEDEAHLEGFEEYMQ